MYDYCAEKGDWKEMKIVNHMKKGVLSGRGILRFRHRMYIIQYEGVYPAAKAFV